MFALEWITPISFCNFITISEKVHWYPCAGAMLIFVSFQFLVYVLPPKQAQDTLLKSAFSKNTSVIQIHWIKIAGLVLLCLHCLNTTMKWALWIRILGFSLICPGSLIPATWTSRLKGKLNPQSSCNYCNMHSTCLMSISQDGTDEKWDITASCPVRFYTLQPSLLPPISITLLHSLCTGQGNKFSSLIYFSVKEKAVAPWVV